MASSLSNLVDNLAERIHKIKCKDCDCFLEYESVKSNLTKYKCLSCNKDYSNKLDEKLKKQFKNTFKFSYNDINKFILLLKKVFIHMITWMNGKIGKFNETKLPKKEELYSNVNMGEVTELQTQITCMRKEFVKILKF